MVIHKLPAILKHFTVVAGQLGVGGVSMPALASSFGTPFYVYDAATIRQNYLSVARSLSQFTVAYSIKANPSLGICKLINSAGCWAEVASGGELYIAKESGFPRSLTIFAGPAKQEWELREAFNSHVGIFNAESCRELDLFARWTSDNSPCPPVCLRVNTLASAASAGEQMVGGPSRFGFDEEMLPDLIGQYKSKLNIVGLHVYTGSQILEAGDIIANFERAFSLFTQSRQTIGETFSTLVFGGGFGVPNDDNEPKLNLEKVSAGITRIIEQDQSVAPLRLIIELGRFLVASAGIFVTRVIDVKKSRGRTFVLTDGGINNFLRPAFMKVAHPVYLLEKLDEPAILTAHIGGPLCTPLDEYGKDLKLPHVELGDLVGVFNAGAYGFSMSMHQFLGHPSPAEILVDNGTVSLIRRRGELCDLVMGQKA
jgi:diaminopimelate decarboxylase